MKCFPERALRKVADSSTLKMIDFWHSLCREKVGSILEVVFVDRREYPYHGIDKYIGELNTAIPQQYGGRLLLVMLLENIKKLNMIVVTHELGHWILRLQGLIELENKHDKYNYLCSLCSHPALYELQRSFGHEPQKEIDRRVNHDIALLRGAIEPNDEKLRLEKALYYTDDLINCSRSTRVGLERILLKRLPNIAKMVEKILDLERSRDLTKIEEILPFSKDVVQKLGLVGNWFESNGLDILRKDLAKLNAEKHRKS